MLNDFINNLNDLSKTAPFVGGVVAVAITGLMGFIFLKAPKRILLSIWNTLTIDYTVNNSGYGNNHQKYINIMEWFSTFDGKKITRNFSFESSNWASTGQVGIGLGNHYLIYNKIPLIIKVYNLDSSGSEKQKREIKIKTFWFFKKYFFEIVKQVTADKVKEGEPASFHTYDNVNKIWSKSHKIPNRDLSTVITDEDELETIIDKITEFRNNKEWYVTRGIPYKMTFLLYGPPGSGKTSIIKAIASHFNLNICSIELHSVGDSTFSNMFFNLPKNSMVILEDIDTCNSVSERGNSINNKEPLEDSQYSSLNLSTILNTLDGVVELDGQIIFMTTNHPEKLDPALYRPGRVDFKKKIQHLSTAAVIKYTKLMYPDYKPNIINNDARIAGARLQEIFMRNKHNAVNFEREVNDILHGKTDNIEVLKKC